MTPAADRAALSALPVVSRRRFLKGLAVAVAAAGGGVLLGCEFDPEDTKIAIPDETWAYADNVPPPPEVIRRDQLGFFSPEEAATVEAFTARLIPGSPADPGAREAGVVTYIDTALALVDGFWRPTYTRPPFAETYTGEPLPEASAGGTDRIFVAEDEVDRYGFQSPLTPREIYRQGLPFVDALAREQFGARFTDLTEDEQDEVVAVIADGEADTFEEPSASLFFDTIRQDTIYGMFADPAYGGNLDMVGWRLIGYPGAQRAYTPLDLQVEGPPRPPQSLDQLHDFNVGLDVNCEIVLPVSDSNPRNQQVPATRD